MDNVIDIRARIDLLRQGKRIERHWEKIRTLHKVIQCASCRLKCAMCGHLLSEHEAGQGTSVPMGYVFCDGCRAEFEDFIAVSSGEKSADVFWHNAAWMDMWSSWLDYQQAIRRFMRSPEFKLLLSEIEA